jgi:tetratricopeptide (TPR) repeat protein
MAARRLSFLLSLAGILLLLNPLLPAQQPQVGKIIGLVRVLKGDFPPHPIMLSLELHGSTINSVYADGQGRFGFYDLAPNIYHVIIKDDAYEPTNEMAVVNPAITTTTFVMVTLTPLPDAKQDSLPRRIGGSNPGLVSLTEYTKKFPKPAVKEFEKGTKADQSGKKEEALRHYQKAVEIAPDFYPARNNIGSHYLDQQRYAEARKEFAEVVRLNQSDAAGYFNLSNVCMLMGDLKEAQRYLDEGLRRQPDAALGQFLLGMLEMQNGKMTEAEGALKHAMELDPMMPQPRLQLINLYLKERRNQEATASLRDFLKAFPDGPFSPKAQQVLKRLESADQPSPHQ